jgi:hypothetical protein
MITLVAATQPSCRTGAGIPHILSTARHSSSWPQEAGATAEIRRIEKNNQRVQEIKTLVAGGRAAVLSSRARNKGHAGLHYQFVMWAKK